MMTPRDRDYFMLRAEQEQAAAERAKDPKAKRVHLDLAGLYLSRSSFSQTVEAGADLE
jgi:hypothetical protein